MTIQAWSILVWKARPTQSPESNSELRRPVRNALVAQSAARTRRRISNESEMLPWASRIVTGVAAKTSAATRPANAPPTLRTAR